MKKVLTLALSLGYCLLLIGQQKPSPMWLQQKFSMFIHFGLYSAYGGVYEGEKIEKGYSEQIQSFAGIFSDWYAESADAFDPIHFDADSIVALAQSAGMRSIVFTAKHHDGFCMYHSQYTDFNIVEATPYGKDMLLELSQACKRAGMGLGIYYSLIDWHYPQAAPISSHNADLITPQHYQYSQQQVEELLTHYGNISEIWFDMGSLTYEQSRGLYELVTRLQPHCMVSGRLGNDVADFSVMPDNELPDYTLSGAWQTAASVFEETWGYRSWQVRDSLTYKVEEKITDLVKVVSRGGNYLLNIGPRADGTVVPYERELLNRIGVWLDRYGEAIYATQGNPFEEHPAWGEITQRDNTLYLFVKKAYQGKNITLPSWKGTIASIATLYGHRSYRYDKERHSFFLPQNGDTPYTVVKVTFETPFAPQPTLATDSLLTTADSQPTFGHASLDYYCGYKSLLSYHWYVSSKQSSLQPTLYYTESEVGKELTLSIDGVSRNITLQDAFSTHQQPVPHSITLGKRYIREGTGVFGTVEEEGKGWYDVEQDTLWQECTTIRPYQERSVATFKPKYGMLLLQEINSTVAQTIAVNIAYQEGYYVLLNGGYVTAHLSALDTPQHKTLLLPLKKGKNQLIVKLFSRYKNRVQYAVQFPKEWSIFSQSCGAFPLDATQQTHSISIRLANPASRVTPLDASNLRIGITDKNQ